MSEGPNISSKNGPGVHGSIHIVTVHMALTCDSLVLRFKDVFFVATIVFGNLLE